VNSRAANLEKYQFKGGDDIHSNPDSKIPGWGISLISVAGVCLMLGLAQRTLIWRHSLKKDKKEGDPAEQTAEPVDVILPGSTSAQGSQKRDDDLTVTEQSISTNNIMRDSKHSISSLQAEPAQTVASSGLITFLEDTGSTEEAGTAKESRGLIDTSSSFSEQLMFHILCQYKIYRPLCKYYLLLI